MIGIIDYGIGNLGSVANALKKLKADYFISGNVTDLQKAKLLILPGVGSAQTGMENLKKRKMADFLISEIKREKPFLGICLGMQLLFDFSEEGNISCLKIFKGNVKKFQKMRKVPQIGWNKVTFKKNNFMDIRNNSFFYFVNSYYCLPQDKSIIAGVTNYGEEFASIIYRKNLLATQFHPEKSGRSGFRLLNNFIRKYYAD